MKRSYALTNAFFSVDLTTAGDNLPIYCSKVCTTFLFQSAFAFIIWDDYTIFNSEFFNEDQNSNNNTLIFS